MKKHRVRHSAHGTDPVVHSFTSENPSQPTKGEWPLKEERRYKRVGQHATKEDPPVYEKVR